MGVSGSGKQSLTRFAAALGGCACQQLELTKAYGLTEFREDLKVGSGSCITSCMKLVCVFDLLCHVDARVKSVLQKNCGGKLIRCEDRFAQEAGHFNWHPASAICVLQY